MVTLEQIRAARAMLGLKQHELAHKAGISTGTLNNIERGVQTDPKLSTMRAIQKALENEGIEFIADSSGNYGIQINQSRNKNPASTILLIDDSESDRRLYGAWLEKQDKPYEIIEASNAKEGYEAFNKHTPACIILDFMMYGKDGFQLLAEMREKHLSLPPIIFVTAMHSDVMENDARKVGVHTYLDKNTLTREKFNAAVHKALA